MRPARSLTRHAASPIFRWWRSLTGDVPIDDRNWAQACARIELLSALEPASLARLRDKTARFLRIKNIVGAGDFDLSEEQRLLVAVLCCLPLLEQGPAAWRGWIDVVVYPEAFRVRRQEDLHDDGVVTEWMEEIDGEAWSQGPLILSWAAIEEDLDDPRSGSNVVAHEIAHKLDLLDGVLDGTPPLPASSHRTWRHAMQSAFDALLAARERGEETSIDPYAAEGPDEFFAVISEAYFSVPELLRAELPDVHAALRDFYVVEIG